MVKEWYVIISDNGSIIRNSQNNIRFFESANEAMMAISTDYHDSPYLRPVKWKRKPIKSPYAEE